jgi:hypothetical protein
VSRPRPRWRPLLVGLLVGLLAGLLVAGAASAAEPPPRAGSVRVYRFDDLDVEGRVKAPQLMYFLKRIRAKFRSFRLPEQNFSRRTLETRDAGFL